MRFAKLTGTLLVILPLIISLAVAKTEKEKLEDLLKRQSDISTKLKKVRSALKKAKRKEYKMSVDLQRTEQRLEKTKAKLEETTDRLFRVKVQLDTETERLKEAKRRYNKHNEALSGRLVEIYKRGDLGFLEVLLASADFSDFVTRSRFVKDVLDQDVALLNGLQKSKNDIACHREQIAQKREQVSSLRTEIAARHRTITAEYGHKRQILRSIQYERAAYERALEELEENSRQIERMLKRLLATPEGRKRYAQPWRGSFSRPVNGHITSGFGMRTHPIFKITKMHTGIDIAAPSGAPIYASADGEVVYSGWWGGYGKVVIIDHGGGIATLYGHCSSLLVSSGQQVKQGQAIAKVGSTGFSTGPHVHFEIRKNGMPINPIR